MTGHLPSHIDENEITDIPPTVARVFEAAREPSRHRRNRLAEGFAFALVAGRAYDSSTATGIAVDAMELTDALIAELDK